MALELVGGAAIGTLFAALYDVVKEEMGKARRLKTLLRGLRSTLDSLQPLIIQQIGDQNEELGLPNHEIEALKRQMEEGTNLVGKLSGAPKWNFSFCRKPRLCDQLLELDCSLKNLLENLMLQEARDVKETLLLARQNHERITQFQGSNTRMLEQLIERQQLEGPNTRLIIQQLMEKQQKAWYEIANNVGDTKKLLEVERSVKSLLKRKDLQHEVKKTLLLASQNAEILRRLLDSNMIVSDNLLSGLSGWSTKDSLVMASQTAEILLKLERSTLRRALAEQELQPEAMDIMMINEKMESERSSAHRIRDSTETRVAWLVEGAPLLAAVDELLGVVIQAKSKSKNLGPLLEDLQSTLNSVKENMELGKHLRHRKKEIQQIRLHIEEGVELVSSCSEISPWNNYKRHKYASNLLRLDKYFQNVLRTLQERCRDSTPKHY